MNIKFDDIDLMAAGLGAPPEYWEGKWSGLSGIIGSARRIVTEFQAEAASLRSAGLLTERGVDDRLSALANQELERLDAIGAETRAKALKHRDVLRARLLQVAGAPTDAAAAAIRDCDTLARLLELPDPERWATIARAVDEGDELVTRAVLNAPLFVQRQVLLPEMLADLRNRLAEGRDPAIAQELRELERALHSTDQALRAARDVISGTPGLTEASRSTIRQKLDPLAA